MVRVVPMRVGQTALSGTTDTDTTVGGAAFSLPLWAKSIIGMSIIDVPDLPTANQRVISRANSGCESVGVGGCEALPAPIGSILGASGGGQFAARKELYDWNLPVNGGELITFAMRPLLTSTSAHYGGIEILVSDAKVADDQRRIKGGALTTDTVINAENPGTAYSISGAREIVELIGVTGPSTIATSEGYFGSIRYSSTEFAGFNNADLMLNPVGGGLATLSIAFIDGVSRRKCNLPCQPVSSVNIQDYANFISSANIGTAVNWVSGVVYVK